MRFHLLCSLLKILILVSQTFLYSCLWCVNPFASSPLIDMKGDFIFFQCILSEKIWIICLIFYFMVFLIPAFKYLYLTV